MENPQINLNGESLWQHLSIEHFLAGYNEADAIYDEPENQ
jgi:hypothetical protein